MLTSIEVSLLTGVVRVVELSVFAWSGNGSSILYVNRAGERSDPVARYDRSDGRTIVHVPELLEPALAAIQSWRAKQKEPTPAPRIVQGSRPAAAPRPTAAAPRPTAVAASVPPLPMLNNGEDLAGNPPGAALIDKIRSLENEHGRFVRWFCRIFGVQLAGEEWRLGLAGEQVTGTVLDRLPEPSWHVLHGIPWPSGSDTDHLVIGAPGVITINTKHHPRQRIWTADGRLKVGNSTKDYVRDAVWEADRVAKVLKTWCGWSVPVRPMLAFVGVERINVAAPHERVIVTDVGELDKVISGLPPLMSAVRVDQVFQVARRRSVWGSAPRGRRR